MKIEYVEGDMFASDIKTLVHGCNAQGKMGSGVAKIVRERFPAAYAAYMAAHASSGLHVGQVIWAEDGGKVIANAITQENYGKDGGQYVVYQGVRDAFRAINDLVSGFDDKRLCLPKIGAGLGGGDWAMIERIIEDECKGTQPIVFLL